MKLNNELYTITAHNADGLTYTLSLRSDSLIYRAHFPERPITPGVCIIQIAGELLELTLNRSLELIEVVNAKYLAVINPVDTPEITYTFSKLAEVNDGTACKVAVTVSFGDIVYSKLSLIYKKS